MNRTKKIVWLALLSAIAIVLNMGENMMPLPLGIRFGFANIIAMITILMFDWKEMLIINSMRVLMTGLLMGTFMSYPFLMSVGGVCLSSLALIICFFLHSSLPFTGVICAFAHNLGQILVLSFFISSSAFMPYLFIMGLMAILTGLMTGIATREIMKRIKKPKES